MHLAAEQGNVNLAGWLIEHGADPSARMNGCVFNQILFRVFSYLILHSETDRNTIAVPRVPGVRGTTRRPVSTIDFAPGRQVVTRSGRQPLLRVIDSPQEIERRRRGSLYGGRTVLACCSLRVLVAIALLPLPPLTPSPYRVNLYDYFLVWCPRLTLPVR